MSKISDLDIEFKEYLERNYANFYVCGVEFSPAEVLELCDFPKYVEEFNKWITYNKKDKL
jgi:hypothetical protein